MAQAAQDGPRAKPTALQTLAAVGRVQLQAPVWPVSVVIRNEFMDQMCWVMTVGSGIQQLLPDLSDRRSR